ncbi:hypothetical protein ACIOWG_00920 [Streptomyces sp. NPDC087658]|uniref:hypothetical protein n=1 Tax=Streptomyces sp. NPDC087658 TaxID=3365800 RepID=UPI00382C9197
MSEELYHSVLNSNGNWPQCEHLGGAILGFDTEVPAAIEDVLASAPMAVLSESESLIYTGRNDAEEEGYESTRAVTVPVGSKVDLIEIEDLSQVITARSGRFTTDVKSPLMLLVLRPGQKLRVSALRHEGSSLVRIGSAMKLFFAER